MFSLKRRPILPSVVFICALVVRFLFIALLGSEQIIYDSLHDQYIYIDLAKSLTSGRGFSLSFGIFMADAHVPTSIQPPIYPLLVAALFSFFGENYLAIRLMQVVLGAAVCVVVFLMTRKMLGQTVGLVAGLFMGIYPPLVMYTRPIMTETLYTLLLSLIVLLLVHVALERFRLIHFVVLGGLFGVTFLVRPEILLLVPLAVLLIGWRWLRQLHYSRRRLAEGCILAGLAAALVVSPWAVRNWHVHGEPLLFPNKRWATWEENWLRYMRTTTSDWQKVDCHNGINCPVPDFQQLSEVERDRYLARLGRDFVISHPFVFARYAVSRFLRSYPLIPREELPPPVGYKGVRQPSTPDVYHATALEDLPAYLTGTEKLRVWSFRLMFGLAVLGIVVAIRTRQWVILLPSLIICFNIASAFLLQGKERLRLPADPYLIIIAAYAFVSVAINFQKTVSQWWTQPSIAPHVQDAEV